MVSKTNELRKLLISETKTASGLTNVFFAYTSKKINPPYIVLSLTELSTENGRTQNELEINIYGNDHSTVETYADKVQDHFDHGNFKNASVSIYTYRNRRNWIAEDDKDVHRIRITIEVESYSTALT